MKRSTSKPVITITLTANELGAAIIAYARRDDPSVPDEAMWCTCSWDRDSDSKYRIDDAATIWWTEP